MKEDAGSNAEDATDPALWRTPAAPASATTALSCATLTAIVILVSFLCTITATRMRAAHYLRARPTPHAQSTEPAEHRAVPVAVFCDASHEFMPEGSFGRFANELLELVHATHWAAQANRTLLIEPFTEHKRKIVRVDQIFDITALRRTWPCIRVLDHGSEVELKGRHKEVQHTLDAVLASRAPLVTVPKKVLFFEGRHVPHAFHERFYGNLRLVPAMADAVQRTVQTLGSFVGVHLRSFKEPGQSKGCPGRVHAMKDFHPKDGKYSHAHSSVVATCWMAPEMIRKCDVPSASTIPLARVIS